MYQLQISLLLYLPRNINKKLQHFQIGTSPMTWRCFILGGTGGGHEIKKRAREKLSYRYGFATENILLWKKFLLNGATKIIYRFKCKTKEYTTGCPIILAWSVHTIFMHQSSNNSGTICTTRIYMSIHAMAKAGSYSDVIIGDYSY